MTKSGVGVASMGVMRTELIMKSIVPVVMAGVLGIYGLTIAVIISIGINPNSKSYYLFDGYAHLTSGLACDLAGLSAEMAIRVVGDAGIGFFNSGISCHVFGNFNKLLSWEETFKLWRRRELFKYKQQARSMLMLM